MENTNQIKPGVKTTEFWVTSIIGAVGPLLTFLVGLQIITAEESEVISTNAESIVKSVAVVVSNITSILTVLGYNKGRIQLKAESIREAKIQVVADRIAISPSDTINNNGNSANEGQTS